MLDERARAQGCKAEARLEVKPQGGGAYAFTLAHHLALPTELASRGERVLCVIDQAVAGFARALIADGWFGAAEVCPVVLDPPRKTLDTAERIWKAAAAAGRVDLMVAVGGGRVCDLVGFTASCLYRGTPMVFFPTTPLAVMDAALSGKTGLDCHGIKNMVGSLHYPRAVFCALEVFDTLAAVDRVSGFAESVKIAVTSSRTFFEHLEGWARAGGPRGGEFFATVLESSRLKAALVASPPEGRKHSLYGHGIGHALESLGAPDARHGDCVSVGLVCEGWIAVRRGVWSEAEWRRQTDLLASLGLPVRLPPDIPAEAIVAQAARDKYGRDGCLSLVLPEAIGRVHAPTGRAWTSVGLDDVLSALRDVGERLGQDDRPW